MKMRYLIASSVGLLVVGMAIGAATRDQRKPTNEAPAPAVIEPAAAKRVQPIQTAEPTLEQRAAELRGRLGEGYQVRIEPPFVVAGDVDEPTLRQWSVGTVRWAVAKLKQDYFQNDPPNDLTIYLFRDRSSYEKHCGELFDINPTSPFGFYSTRHRSLVMNIATGGGTLVHEIVHPYLAANFPRCPTWFNEGLASLYEQSTERDGRIVGLTNWRLPVLQKAIRGDGLPTFRELMALSAREFYGDQRGVHYAQARYLLYYLQQKGLLRDYYRAFHEDHLFDPTGHRTLQRLLGEVDMAAFQKQWQQWVLGLRYPPSE